jgi:hypothetical protein
MIQDSVIFERQECAATEFFESIEELKQFIMSMDFWTDASHKCLARPW